MDFTVKNANLKIKRPTTVVEVPIHGGWQGSSNNVNNYPASKHAVIPVSEGDVVYMTKPPKKNQDHSAGIIYSWLSSYTEPTKNGDTYSNIGKRVVVDAEIEAVEVTAPANAQYIWVGVYNSGNGFWYYPTYLVVNRTTRYILNENVI